MKNSAVLASFLAGNHLLPLKEVQDDNIVNCSIDMQHIICIMRSCRLCEADHASISYDMRVIAGFLHPQVTVASTMIRSHIFMLTIFFHASSTTTQNNADCAGRWECW